MDHKFKYGDRVRIKERVVEYLDDGMGANCCAAAGDVVIIRKKRTYGYHYSVSHEGRTDGKTFGVYEPEIELV